MRHLRVPPDATSPPTVEGPADLAGPLDAAAWLATRVCGAAMSAVTLVDAGGLRLVSSVGEWPGGTDAARRLLAYTLAQDGFVLIEDVGRVGYAEVAARAGIRSYAGLTLRDAMHVPIGTLAVADASVGRLSREHEIALRAVAGYVSTHLELQRTRAELTDAGQRIHRASELEREFVALISHEVRTPLTSIQGYLELILDDIGAESDQHQPFANKIKANSQRLLRLVDHLILIADARNGALSFGAVRSDLAAITRSSTAGLAEPAQRAGVRLSVEAATPVAVDADPQRLGQVVENLVGNALAFTPRGGSIQVRVSDSDGWSVVEVVDTGVGIPAEEQGLVFEPFFRGGHARDNHTPGAGMGLAVVHAIVAAHRGNAQLSSVAGQGTAVRVALPSAVGTVAVPERPAASVPAGFLTADPGLPHLEAA